MSLKVTAIFDIGKTNKKIFLFDEDLNEVYQEYIYFPEIKDDDGFACDDLNAIEHWVLNTFSLILKDERFELQAINFSAYGATLVHLDESYKPITPLYNYIKPYPSHLLELFKNKHGELEIWAQETASPILGMLNAGLQLFWLKYEKPKLFSKIKYSLFLPQYLSFLFSKKLVSEYTGIGCHTGMWNFEQNEFHNWMYEEGFVALLPAIHKKCEVAKIAGTSIKVGAGIHDSSAALIPYMRSNDESFVLLSTGTWSICLNPFNNIKLSTDELAQDCMCYLQPNGKPVKASRLFLGNEYNGWINKLSQHFKVDGSYHKKVAFDTNLFEKAERMTSPLFHWESISHTNNEITRLTDLDLSWFDSFEEAYHHLIKELAELQVEKIWLVLNGKNVRRIFLDGGFVDNSIFINILAEKLSDFEIIPSKIPWGSAIGAALSLNNNSLFNNNNVTNTHK
jgi:L-fuculokinase